MHVVERSGLPETAAYEGDALRRCGERSARTTRSTVKSSRRGRNAAEVGQTQRTPRQPPSAGPIAVEAETEKEAMVSAMREHGYPLLAQRDLCRPRPKGEP